MANRRAVIRAISGSRIAKKANASLESIQEFALPKLTFWKDHWGKREVIEYESKFDSYDTSTELHVRCCEFLKASLDEYEIQTVNVNHCSEVLSDGYRLDDLFGYRAQFSFEIEFGSLGSKVTTYFFIKDKKQTS